MSGTDAGRLPARGTDLRLLILFLAGGMILLFHTLSPKNPSFHTWRQAPTLRLAWNGHQLETDAWNNPSPLHAPPPHIAYLLFHPVSVNDADFQLLVSLPGIGPWLASEILKTKALHGPFRSAKDLLKVRGIGKVRMKKLASQITF